MLRKITSISLITSVAFLSLLSFSQPADAATTSCTPKIELKETKKHSVKLKITCSSLIKTKVSIKVLVTNNDTDTDSYKKAKATLGKRGSVRLKINGLDSATSYSFKVKVKKTSDSSYSSYSGSINVTTNGSDYNPEIKKISSITDDSVKIKVYCDDLEEEDVDVQVAYKKKKTWSTKTFSLTLDDDGEESFTLDDLKSDTLYSFKIRIKKSDEDSYSAYSSIETATTDED